LVTGAGRRRLHASPADSAALVRAAGPTVDLSVRGVEEGNDVRVRSFSVTSVGGVPVVDGIVRADGDHYWLDTPNGRVELGNPPQSLRGLVGARVWVQGPLDRGPNAYGVLV